MCSSFRPCKEGEKPEPCIPPLLPDYARQRKSIPISMNGMHHYFACQLVQSFIRTRLPGSLQVRPTVITWNISSSFHANAYLPDLNCRLYKLYRNSKLYAYRCRYSYYGSMWQCAALVSTHSILVDCTLCRYSILHNAGDNQSCTQIITQVSVHS